jgi:hypothetical protein
LTLIVESIPSGKKVSVVAIAPIDKQVDPIIESVKPITEETVANIEGIANSLQQPVVVKTCDKKTINSAGQEVCLDESTSSIVNIQPGETPTSGETTSPASPTSPTSP